MPVWLIPITYAAGAVACGLVVPRVETALLPPHGLGIAVASVQAFLSAAASGMMALTGIVFALAFVLVQFSAIAYSPRLVNWFAADRLLYHSLGVFIATFLYSLATLMWVDRYDSGRTPIISGFACGGLCVFSMILFSFLVHRLSDLEITGVLEFIGRRGRAVIGGMGEPLAGKSYIARAEGRGCAPSELGPVTQSLIYRGVPQTITKFDIDALMTESRRAGAVIVIRCAVGDTIVDGMPYLDVHAGDAKLVDKRLFSLVHLGRARTFEQDPAYAIRLLVDIAIKALSPAINDPSTAVQAIAQIEDLLGRLGHCMLDNGYIEDRDGVLRLVIPMPRWEDYLELAFDEIRQFGASSVQVMRRMRAALSELQQRLPEGRAEAVRRYIRHLDRSIGRSLLDLDDQDVARQEDRQGIGLSRGERVAKPASAEH